MSSGDLANLLQGRLPRHHLLQLHARAIRLNAHQDNLVATRLINQFPSQVSSKIFSHLIGPNIFPFNALIGVFASEGLFDESFSLFNLLRRRALSPNGFTFSFLVKACFRSDRAWYVRQVHAHVLKAGFGDDPAVGNGLVGVYGKVFGDSVSAQKVFDEFPVKESASCRVSLIKGFLRSGRTEDSLQALVNAVREDISLDIHALVCVLSACNSIRLHEVGRWVDVLSGVAEGANISTQSCDTVNTILVFLYGKLGRIEDSKDRFCRVSGIGRRSTVPWNVMITAFAQNGFPMEAISTFREMVTDITRIPNHVTMVSVLSACAEVGDLELGKWVHNYIESAGVRGILRTNAFLGTGLIDMYCKCGSLKRAEEVFNVMASKDVVSFNAMIMGLAVNGRGDDALRLFYDMQEQGLRPNAGTFLAALCACSHSGNLEEGRQIFSAMTSGNSENPVSAGMEHYACYTDILSRAGRINEALELIHSMPFEPNNIVWGALLCGSMLHNRGEVAQYASLRLTEADPEDSAGYVMLANTFARERKWGDVAVLRSLMREKGVRKQPGNSWISVDGDAHEFVAGVQNTHHPRIDGVYRMLDSIFMAMRLEFAPS
ncbi:hypothetical protein MLD38_022901 [Melastoma candidum]|uniref:Uncharacterized protein n=1 Tax=Melastoma candidum TaxID=119954 RepID=A0ACB9QLC9_9MYRT|nr:hypothetical protein MLD38_022901 [Melastoma candidum]